jgi:xanthine dehydrogenase small subunit
MNALRFCLNGDWVEVSGVSPTLTLLRYLRDVRGLAGTKEGCAEGDCGACTVAVVETAPSGEQVFRAVNACLVLLPMVQGKHVFTVEALKDTSSGQHHPAQEAMARALGSQCGYCTPGIVMTLFEATYRKDLDEPWKLDDQLCGNLCRCTGYRPIRAAAEEVAGRCPSDRFSTALPQEAPAGMALSYLGEGQRFFTPTTTAELWSLLEQNPEARFVAGGTDLSLEVTKKFARPPLLISLEGLKELKVLDAGAAGFRLGAGVFLSDLEAFAKGQLPPLERMLRYFGARQIKHRGTVGGNLCTASPIGDLAPVLLSLGATAVLLSKQGERRVALDQFFLSYRKTAMARGEVLGWVEVPPLASDARAVAYKVSKRRELDISAVSAGLYVDLDAQGNVATARFAFGGVAATPRRAEKAEAAALGKPWSEATAEACAVAVLKDFTPLSDHRGSADYRIKVAANLLRGFFDETRSEALPRLKPLHAATVQPGVP